MDVITGGTYHECIQSLAAGVDCIATGGVWIISVIIIGAFLYAAFKIIIHIFASVKNGFLAFFGSLTVGIIAIIIIYNMPTIVAWIFEFFGK